MSIPATKAFKVCNVLFSLETARLTFAFLNTFEKALKNLSPAKNN